MIMCISKQSARLEWNHWSLFSEPCPLLWLRSYGSVITSKMGKQSSWDRAGQNRPWHVLGRRVKDKDPGFFRTESFRHSKLFEWMFLWCSQQHKWGIISDIKSEHMNTCDVIFKIQDLTGREGATNWNWEGTKDPQGVGWDWRCVGGGGGRRGSALGVKASRGFMIRLGVLSDYMQI